MPFINSPLSLLVLRAGTDGRQDPWKLRAVPQGSALGPVLFHVFLNDLGVGRGGVLNEFAHTPKLGAVDSTEGGEISFQREN